MGVIVDHITRNWFPWRRGGVEICGMAEYSLVSVVLYLSFRNLGNIREIMFVCREIIIMANSPMME